jgi:hypothetical protein
MQSVPFPLSRLTAHLHRSIMMSSSTLQELPRYEIDLLGSPQFFHVSKYRVTKRGVHMHPTISLPAIVRAAPLAPAWRIVNKPVRRSFFPSPHPLLPSLFHAPLSSVTLYVLCAHPGISKSLGFPAFPVESLSLHSFLREIIPRQPFFPAYYLYPTTPLLLSCTLYVFLFLPA